jgi:ribonucleoside-diphosphate reductase alpha chain
LRGIGGSRSVGFGAQQVRSLPDAVARALEMHIESLQPKEAGENGNNNGNNNGNGENGNHHDHEPATSHNHSLDLSSLTLTGNLCPECGCNTMVYEEGCKKCYSCGYSEC